MRFVSLIPAAVALFVGGAAYAQAWDIFTSREDFFAINLPGEPKVTTSQYKTAKGTTLPAKRFEADAPAGSILAGKYVLTVVDYNTAKGELGTAIEEAAARYRTMGKMTYDAVNMLDNHRSWRQTIDSPTQRILTEILVAKNNRLYISEATTALNIPPPAQFQASLQILDENGQRIRLQTAELAQSAAANEVIPVTPAQVARAVGRACRSGDGHMAGEHRRIVPDGVLQVGRTHEDQAQRRSLGRHGDESGHDGVGPADPRGRARRPVHQSVDRQGDFPAGHAAEQSARLHADRRAGAGLAGSETGSLHGLATPQRIDSGGASGARPFVICEAPGRAQVTHTGSRGCPLI